MPPLALPAKRCVRPVASPQLTAAPAPVIDISLGISAIAYLELTNQQYLEIASHAPILASPAVPITLASLAIRIRIDSCYPPHVLAFKATMTMEISPAPSAAILAPLATT